VDLEALLRECIVKVCDVPPESVTSETDLDSLGVDSLASAEIIFEIEIRLQRELPNHLLRQVQQVRTVGDVARRLEEALEEPTTSAAS
jgi:acyl carrier protein